VKVVSARTLADALSVLGDAGPDARILAGGTDLMVEMESGRTRPDLVVDVWKIDALRGIRATERGLEIGALATCSDLLRSQPAREHADILVQAAREVGAVQIQNRATVGGNLGTASPAADLNPVLFALGAQITLESRRGTREVAAEEFVRGYRTTARAHDELITRITIPYRPPDEHRAFRKVGTRRAQSIAKVVVAVALRVDQGSVRSLRAAAGSVADRTVLLRNLEVVLQGRALPSGPDLARACAGAVAADCSPRDDVRSTAAYRSFVLARLLERALTGLTRNPVQRDGAPDPLPRDGA
jgi:carbon-monoxide dehydrogenase medium subunit